MIQFISFFALILATSDATGPSAAERNPDSKGVLLEDLTWIQAERMRKRSRRPCCFTSLPKPSTWQRR
jgi:hypothetical protein